VLKDSVHPRLQLSSSGRPLNFTVRRRDEGSTLPDTPRQPERLQPAFLTGVAAGWIKRLVMALLNPPGTCNSGFIKEYHLQQ
jgi:hypothetical protein